MATRRRILLCIVDAKAIDRTHIITPSLSPSRWLHSSVNKRWVSLAQCARGFSSSRSQWREAVEQQGGRGQPKIDRQRSKVFRDADEAVADIQSGSTIFSAGFGLCGTAGLWSIVIDFKHTDCLQKLSSRPCTNEESNHSTV
jgi:3-oxoacid CoA-transferase